MSCLRSRVTIVFRISRGRLAVAPANLGRTGGGPAGKLEVEWQEVRVLGRTTEGVMGVEGVLFCDCRCNAIQPSAINRSWASDDERDIPLVHNLKRRRSLEWRTRPALRGPVPVQRESTAASSA